jgi:hypothetical protein
LHSFAFGLPDADDHYQRPHLIIAILKIKDHWVREENREYQGARGLSLRLQRFFASKKLSMKKQSIFMTNLLNAQ